MRVTNTLFDTCPGVIHAHGTFPHKLYWDDIQAEFFASVRRHVGASPRVTVLTCNNGHGQMGLLEQSLDHLGVPWVTAGRDVLHWVNSRHKPLTIVDALSRIDTEYTLYADSRDAILLDDPERMVEQCQREFPHASLVFSADRYNYPPRRAFRQFEDSLPNAPESEFKYLNTGAWLGTTAFCREFYQRALDVGPVPEAPASDQGVVRQLLPEFYPRVDLDRRCVLFQNIGFLRTRILRIES